MNILLVEDDEDKREQIKFFILEKIECNLVEAKSFQSGLKELKTKSFDFILLDMTMPTFDITLNESGGRSQPFGGEMLLYEMQRRKIFTKVVVVTQFDNFGKGDNEITLSDLDSRLGNQFGDFYLGAVQYSVTYTSWKEGIFKVMKDAGLLKY